MPKFTGDLDALNKYLLDHSYVDGFVPSSNDAEAFAAVKDAPDASNHPNALRWFNHIASFSEDERKAWAAAAAGATEEAAEEEDDFDLFADDEEAEAEHEAMIQRRADEAIAKKAAERAAAGVVVVMRSAVIFDIKPWDDTTDLKELEEMVRGIEMDGLEWKAGELKDIAFGIKKLSILCHIEDEKVSTDAIEEAIRDFEDHVQSVDIAAFTKL